MPGFSLRLPDHPVWWHDPGYSTRAAAILRGAYLDLYGSGTDLGSYYRAYVAVAPLLSRPMCLRQRLRVLFVIGTSYGAVGDFGRAVGALDLACEVSELLPDHIELIELYFARGSFFQGRSELRSAADDYEDCLTLLRVHGDERASATEDSGPDALDDVRLELDVLTNLGGAQYFLGEFDTAQRLLIEARALSWHPRLARMPSFPISVATINWLAALLERARGAPELALAYAEPAAEAFIETALTRSALRSQVLLGDTLLDVAERLPEGSQRAERLELARPHVELAQDLAREARDDGGDGLARLTRVRFDRLSGGRQDRIAEVERVARAARARDDDPLLVQAMTTLADELAAQGDVQAALYRYRDALKLLDGGDTAGLGLLARRALALEGEWRR